MSNIAEELENKKSMKDIYLKMSYDIKNPLTVCYGYLEMMKKDNNNEYIDIIKNELDKCINILDKYAYKINELK